MKKSPIDYLPLETQKIYFELAGLNETLKLIEPVTDLDKNRNVRQPIVLHMNIIERKGKAVDGAIRSIDNAKKFIAKYEIDINNNPYTIADNSHEITIDDDIEEEIAHELIGEFKERFPWLVKYKIDSVIIDPYRMKKYADESGLEFFIVMYRKKAKDRSKWDHLEGVAFVHEPSSGIINLTVVTQWYE
jgi:hypothetical protein